ncbi:MAG: hypothetical protein MUO23_01615 [Anaerolineales bacterium]|nr:hypothetical protein [Anaerolineales bacterium]
MHGSVLDTLVARSITDASFRQRFDQGRLAQDLDELEAPAGVREALEDLSASPWEAFVRQAHSCLQGIEAAIELPAMPSAREGLQPNRVLAEQVA